MKRWLAIVLAGLGGCTASHPIQTQVHVRCVATGAPVEGATVRALAGTLFLPTQQPTLGMAPGETIGPTPDPAASAGRTDAQGIAHMPLASNRPITLRIEAPGCAPLAIRIEMDAHGVARGALWTAAGPRPPSAPPPEGRPLEARVTRPVQPRVR
ncbi:MAG: hypothetical protein MK074_00265 [Phycisphaerales bacterium]|nr:hypothetical protein [Phycisphaerales bacterium]